MRIILIAIVAVVVLGGGGAGAYYYFMKPAEASAGAEVGKNHEEAKAEKGHGGGHGEKTHYEYVELDPLILPIVDQNGVSQVVSVVIALEVMDADAMHEVERMTPKLKDAYIQDMYGELNRHAAMKGGVVQVSSIKERLNKISTQVMGEDVINDVLLQVVQQRPI